MVSETIINHIKKKTGKMAKPKRYILLIYKGHGKSKRVPEKNIYFCFIDYAKDFVWITINCGKFWKRWEYQTT